MSGFTSWEFVEHLSPAGGYDFASRRTSHSNGSLTLYRNYQRVVLRPGVPLLLATASQSLITVIKTAQHLGLRCVLLSDPSTKVQEGRHVSNPASKKFKPHLLYD